MDENSKSAGSIAEKSASSDVEHLQDEFLSVDNEKTSHGHPLQTYLHYAKIQRSYEQADDFETLYQVQEEQMRSEAFCNLSPKKLDAARKLRVGKIYMTFFF